MKRLAVLFILVACAFAQKPDKPLKNGLYAIFNTELGIFTAQLYEKDTPNSVITFVELAQGTLASRDPKTNAMVKRPLYDNTTFYRILPGQAIQGGSPNGTPAYDCGFTIKDEILPGLTFSQAGKLAVANTGAPDSGGCQFFITTGPVASWNEKYTIFGQVMEGLDVVVMRSEEHTSELQSPCNLVCRLLLE